VEHSNQWIELTLPADHTATQKDLTGFTEDAERPDSISNKYVLSSNKTATTPSVRNITGQINEIPQSTNQTPTYGFTNAKDKQFSTTPISSYNIIPGSIHGNTNDQTTNKTGNQPFVQSIKTANDQIVTQKTGNKVGATIGRKPISHVVYPPNNTSDSFIKDAETGVVEHNIMRLTKDDTQKQHTKDDVYKHHEKGQLLLTF